jgi:hypothetical protein
VQHIVDDFKSAAIVAAPIFVTASLGDVLCRRPHNTVKKYAKCG